VRRKRLRIPTKFNLAAIKIEVENDPKFAETTNCIGQTFYQAQKIVLDMDHTPKEFTEHAFCHEVVHYILYVMGEHALRQNEKFVDLFAHFMYQFILQLENTDAEELIEKLKSGLDDLNGVGPAKLMGEIEKHGY
jgi:predicted SprT family Zn-dependent metalloprotease